MKYLKIENNKGFYLKEENPENWSEISTLTKEGLMHLLDKAINSEFEMDEFKEEEIQNKAHHIIYKNLYEKFSDLLLNKTKFKDESEILYKDAMEKYKVTVEEN